MDDAAKAHCIRSVFIMMVMTMLGIGLAWPVFPKLVQDMTGGDISEASYILAFLLLAFAIGQFLFSPLMGVLSDRFGRKPIMLIAIIALFLDNLLIAFAPTIGFILIIRILSGIFAANLTMANAYMADLSTSKTRATNFGIIGAAFGIGFILGPIIAGKLGEIDLRLPFLAAAFLNLLQFIYGYFFLPESLPEEKRSHIQLRNSNPFTGILSMRRFPIILPLLLAFLLNSMTQRGLESIWILYTDFRFNWDIVASSWSLAYVGLLSALTQGVLVRWIVPKIGETKAVFYGLLTASISGFAFAFTANGYLAILIVGIYVVGFDLAGPTLRSLISAPVPENEQGFLQGVIASLNSLAVIIGPFFASMVLADISGASPLINFPGLYFLVGALIMLITTCLISAVLRKSLMTSS